MCYLLVLLHAVFAGSVPTVKNMVVPALVNMTSQPSNSSSGESTIAESGVCVYHSKRYAQKLYE